MPLGRTTCFVMILAGVELRMLRISTLASGYSVY
jgi:hypothetical protein